MPTGDRAGEAAESKEIFPILITGSTRTTPTISQADRPESSQLPNPDRPFLEITRTEG